MRTALFATHQCASKTAHLRKRGQRGGAYLVSQWLTSHDPRHLGKR
jgi:hypothetical protein